jgi:hypothetical protein
LSADHFAADLKRTADVPVLGLWPIKPLDRSVSADLPVSPSRAPAFPVRLMFNFLRFYLIGNIKQLLVLLAAHRAID